MPKLRQVEAQVDLAASDDADVLELRADPVRDITEHSKRLSNIIAVPGQTQILSLLYGTAHARVNSVVDLVAIVDHSNVEQLQQLVLLLALTNLLERNVDFLSRLRV